MIDGTLEEAQAEEMCDLTRTMCPRMDAFG